MMSKSRIALLELYHLKRCQALAASFPLSVWGIALCAVAAVQRCGLRLCERLQAAEDYLIAA